MGIAGGHVAGKKHLIFGKLDGCFLKGFRRVKSQMAGTGQGRSNQAQQHSNGSVAQLDRAADF